MIETGFPNEATPAGSTAYYVCRVGMETSRDNLAGLFLWKKQLNDLYAISDPGVARIKLQWWLQQISLDEASSHPLAKVLQDIYHSSETSMLAIRQIIEAYDKQLHRQKYSNCDALINACNAIGGNFGILFNQASNQKPDENAGLAGSWIILIEWLQNLGMLYRHNIHVLPNDFLAKYNLQGDELLMPQHAHKISLLLTQLLDQVHQKLVDIPSVSSTWTPASASMTDLAQLKTPKSPLGRYLKLRLALLKLLESEQYAVLHQKTSLTPLKKTWLTLF